jgi:hypothetical protein
MIYDCARYYDNLRYYAFVSVVCVASGINAVFRLAKNEIPDLSKAFGRSVDWKTA